MTSFLGPDFLLDTEMACRLYHEHAATQPIIDYHSHLPPAEIAEDRHFENLAEIWLGGDHYKWRAMRWNGIDEHLITGSAGDRAKFDAWAATVPKTIGNPLYHWTHLELARAFGITDRQLAPDTAESIWREANECLARPECSARGLMRQMNVRMVGTTDDPVDDLSHHAKIAADESIDVAVLPSFRPDKCFQLAAADYPEYLSKLGHAADVEIRDMASLYRALGRRLDHFESHGCCIADHGMDRMAFRKADETELDAILARRLAGQVPDESEQDAFMTAILLFVGREYHRRGWVQQYHMGPLRNNSTRGFDNIGPNAGFDSINDRPIAEPLCQLLDALDREACLPRTVLYCVNSAYYDVLSAMAGSFQGEGIAGKIQVGSAWWFNDQLDGMNDQITKLAQIGLLSHFIGMLTDSRSFLSFTRHEYFRRLLCQIIGRWAAAGHVPADEAMLGALVRDICFTNARDYFRIEV
ncbi:glucuronate isomerase [Salinisphaera sp. SWV1]|uniref:glucuronate isomerase n=1 Tax=Salinisphaera sp. SWV1 TaxID=3454139 RepID=UPI003F84AC02